MGHHIINVFVHVLNIPGFRSLTSPSSDNYGCQAARRATCECKPCMQVKRQNPDIASFKLFRFPSFLLLSLRVICDSQKAWVVID